MLGHQLERSLDGFVAAMREMFEPPAFFETLGVRYTGPFDGHDVEGMEKALRHAATYDGPIVVHVVTQKGRGYAPAENDAVKHLHDFGPSLAKPGSYTAAFTEAMIAEAEARPELVAITAAMPDSTGLLPFGERFPGRLIDVGIAEQHAVTSAAGMAMGGLRPVVAVYSTFLTRAIDQVTYDVGLHGLPVVFCLDRAGITGDDGPSHHGVLDMALLTKVPGMTVFAPSSYQELGQMLHDALELCEGPAAIRWSKTDAPQAAPGEVGAGKAARKRPHRPRPLHPRRRQAPPCGRRGRRRAGRRGHRGHRVGRPGGAARPADDRRRRPAPAGDHGRGRHPRGRRRRADRRRHLPARPPRHPAPCARARHPDRLHPPGQARRDPRRARPRRPRPREPRPGT